MKNVLQVSGSEMDASDLQPLPGDLNPGCYPNHSDHGHL